MIITDIIRTHWKKERKSKGIYQGRKMYLNIQEEMKNMQGMRMRQNIKMKRAEKMLEIILKNTMKEKILQ